VSNAKKVIPVCLLVADLSRRRPRFNHMSERVGLLCKCCAGRGLSPRTSISSYQNDCINAAIHSYSYTADAIKYYKLKASMNKTFYYSCCELIRNVGDISINVIPSTYKLNRVRLGRCLMRIYLFFSFFCSMFYKCHRYIHISSQF
jgi:hypothetical protein